MATITVVGPENFPPSTFCRARPDRCTSINRYTGLNTTTIPNSSDIMFFLRVSQKTDVRVRLASAV